MKNLLNDQDPLPPIDDGLSRYARYWVEETRSIVAHPLSRRQAEEREKTEAKKQGEDWKPYSPGLEINGKGQLRTKDYKPPEPPETDIPIPCVVGVDLAATTSTSFTMWFDGKDWHFKNPAEPQTQTASPMDRYETVKAEVRAEKARAFRGEYYIIRGADDQLRSMRCDPDGWIPHKPGDPMPCDPEMNVFCRFECGYDTVIERQAKSYGDKWAETYWEGDEYRIIAWKPAT